MIAKYDLFENPDNRTRNSGYHPRLLKGAPISEADICRHINDSCSITTSDIAGVMEAVCQSIIDNLLCGSDVYLPRLGRFSVTLKGDNCGAYGANPKKLRVKKICFLPSKALKRAMSGMEFSRHRRLKEKNEDE